VKGNKQPTSQIAMPIAIILATFLALFTLGVKMNLHHTGHPSEVVILGGEKYNWIDKEDNRDTSVLKAPETSDHKVYIKGNRHTGSFENIFQPPFMFRMEEDEITEEQPAIEKYINSNIKRAVLLSVK
jgi:hypothetical protein